ncbi:branched-chain amino acid aminotransferase [bacterium]|nr:branched-chain amino acid aminotransferase [candidate division CSSED10-310 bacterium]
MAFGFTKTDFVYINDSYNPDTGRWENEGQFLGPDDPKLMVHYASYGVNYGNSIFEGAKAYLGKDGHVRLFRIEENGKRFGRSAEGILMPPVPVDLFVKKVKELVIKNRNYIPAFDPDPNNRGSLYIRPLLIGEPGLGVRRAENPTFLIFVSPVGPYYATGFNPLHGMVIHHMVRAMPGGHGAYKTGANYVMSMLATAYAKKNGCQEAIWLDGYRHENIEELSACNFMCRIQNTLVTPALSDTILAGITRNSILRLAREQLGMTIEERDLPLEEVLTDADETFGCGTAAVITPIGKISAYHGRYTQEITKDVGELSRKLYDMLTGIQWGVVDDPFKWVTILD